MKNNILRFMCLLFIIAACKKEEGGIAPEFSEYEISVIDYFKDVALGFEFGNASSITRKWYTDMNVFVGGRPSTELLEELERIKSEINVLATDGFQMNIVNDSAQSNYYIFFGSGDEYASLFADQTDFVDNNWGLFTIFWNGQNQLFTGHMYVDIERADVAGQLHLLREELTQSLGLARDSPLYSESIFQSSWTTTTEYTDMDRDLIRLLYHPRMSAGLNTNQVDGVLKAILKDD